MPPEKTARALEQLFFILARLGVFAICYKNCQYNNFISIHLYIYVGAALFGARKGSLNISLRNQRGASQEAALLPDPSQWNMTWQTLFGGDNADGEE
jgi:hypothetical protein